MNTWNSIVHDKAHDATNKHGRAEQHNTDTVHSFISFNSTYTRTYTGCSIMIAPPSTAKTSKTLAKLFLYYNSLNKVTLLCKVSD